MASSKAKFVYLYDEEPFRVRQKDFWPLSQADKVLHKFIPALSHESDGLILQVGDCWDTAVFWSPLCHSTTCADPPDQLMLDPMTLQAGDS